MTDSSAAALDVARANAAGIGRARPTSVSPKAIGSRRCRTSSPAAHTLVSNPPYVADDDPELEPIVRDFRTRRAFGGTDGLDAIRFRRRRPPVASAGRPVGDRDRLKPR